MALRTVKVPEGMEGAFTAAEAVVERYFASRAHTPERGAIDVSGERYVLVRAASLSVEFFGVVRKLYGPGREMEADHFARNILFDLAHAVGKSDARNLAARMKIDDPLAAMAAGPVHFAYTGWASVEIQAEADPVPNEGYYGVFDHTYSFEATAWLEAGAAPSFPACVMSAGYSSGWCSSSYDIDLVATEVMCRARGDEACRFVMAHTSRIDEMVARYREKLVPSSSARRLVPTPDLFAQKRMEEELRRSRDELDARVKMRTRELEAANARLESEIASRAAAERRLAQAQKLEAVGRLAGGIAHDFNNLLGVVLGRSSMVQSRIDRSDPLWEDMEAIRVACRQGASLTRHMIAFSRGQPADVRSLDLNEVVRAFTSEMRSLIGDDVAVAVDVSTDPIAIMADRAQLDQVLFNLVMNARDALGGTGALTIRTQRIATRDLPVTTTTLTAGSYAVLTVSDTGCGMDSETQARIFDPFFTTKAAGSGTGLGLSTVYRVVHQAGGGIALESAPGRGTTFIVFLPLSDKPAEAIPPAESRPRISDGQDTRVLVVEDKGDLRTTIEDGLVAAGYRVVAVGDPLMALALVESGDLELDVLVTDLSMPKLGGRELARRIRTKRRDVRVLYMSGYDRDGDPNPDAPDDDATTTPILQKPFSVEELTSRIERVTAREP